jgi:hypothetical protein
MDTIPERSLEMRVYMEKRDVAQPFAADICNNTGESNLVVSKERGGRRRRGRRTRRRRKRERPGELLEGPPFDVQLFFHSPSQQQHQEASSDPAFSPPSSPEK